MSKYRNTIYTLFLLSICITSCLGRRESVVLKSSPVQIISDSSIFIKNPKCFKVCDSLLFLLGKGNGRLITVLSYPSMEYVGQLCREGRGPNEFLDISCFDVVNDSLYVIPTSAQDIHIISLNDIRNKDFDAWCIKKVNSLVPPNLAYSVTPFGVASVMAIGSRIRISGNQIKESEYGVPYDNPRINKLYLSTLWSGPVDYSVEYNTLVTATFLGEVIEFIDLKTFERKVVVGKEGYPDLLKKGKTISVGKYDGFFDLQIVGDKLYALYSGESRSELIESIQSGKNVESGAKSIRIYNLSGELLESINLDTKIIGFYVDMENGFILGLSNWNNFLKFRLNTNEK